jgi:hypothetical protein
MEFMDSQWSIALSPELHPFIKLVLGTPALQQRLASILETDSFIAESLSIAAEHNIPIEADMLKRVTQPTPMGIGRFGPAPITCSGWPPVSWLPTQSVATGGAPDIDWLWVGERPLLQPFFEDDVRNVSSLPFNRIFRIRTTLESVIAGAETETTLPLKGMIFHMSRCGSTLLAQMFAAVPENCVSSEPEPLDGITQWVQLADIDPQLADKAIQAIVAALGRHRGNNAARHLIKLAPWQTFALPLMRSAFPDVNWVYLYREPVEVMVSVMHRPGLHTVDGLLPAQVTGNAGAGSASAEKFAARVLAAMGETVVENWELGGGMLIAYPDIIEAASGSIMTHFGMNSTAEDTALIRTASRRDAKMPEQQFATDNVRKRTEASDAMIAAAEMYLEPVHQHLIGLEQKTD